jgi:large subunit ribosomal protein L17
MRHSRVINHLGRTSSHRKAMLSNMATSLILHKRITTTTAKAKALKTFVEPLITKSKEDSTHSRRVVFSYLKDKTAVAELFREVSPKVAERPGGYTRILKIGNRIGDNADMCIMELVDYNEAMLGGEAAKAKTTRRRRATKKKEESAGTEKPAKAVKTKAEKTDKPAEKPEDATGNEAVPDAE